MTPEELSVEKGKERTLKRKLRNLRKRVTQGRLTYAQFRAKAAEVIDQVLGC